MPTSTDQTSRPNIVNLGEWQTMKLNRINQALGFPLMSTILLFMGAWGVGILIHDIKGIVEGVYPGGFQAFFVAMCFVIGIMGTSRFNRNKVIRAMLYRDYGDDLREEDFERMLEEFLCKL